MKEYLKRLPILIGLLAVLPEYFRSAVGREYGVGFRMKILLLFRFVRNNLGIESASNFVEHLVMATKILSLPKDLEGCVVECGSFKGVSAANLSLVCGLCGRDLEIFDSFAGLPEPLADDLLHTIMPRKTRYHYQKGDWCGTLDEVKANITRYGNMAVCHFNVGYFNTTLPGFSRDVVFAFLDVDLIGSLENCLVNLWPRLRDEGYVYIHEAPHMEMSFLFFDRDWWKNKLGSVAPGLVGAGCGLGLAPMNGHFGSGLGYAIKNPSGFEMRPG